ncbi:beta-ketoacyl synthase chain length factor [Enterovibrio baiacu]|uniref:beta-ketoacyl synthase chain length factor n=1 Tax=Enterovibrio baiacu TaxID=2491023 RepID=UPI001013A771|nr:beta-ketoacyl synthase chain length factor [Enterovibrio baiacu]MBE1276915.1 3-oxoacyl-ACP synthase [Enterovibrio baiacu]
MIMHYNIDRRVRILINDIINDVIAPPMSSIQFNLQRLNALSPGLENTEAWESWCQQNHAWPEDAPAPRADAIPAMMKRRMSPISKLAVQVATELSRDEHIDFVVFSSRHGELQRTVTLLRDIQMGEPASPTAFSQSVHNTAAGLFTIATKTPVPATSLAAGEDTFHCALTEAAIYLSEHPEHRVLVIDFDAPIPEPYDAFEQQAFQPYALGLLLTKGDEIRIERHPMNGVNGGDTQEKALPQGLAFYAHWLQSNTRFDIESTRQSWRWHIKQVEK